MENKDLKQTLLMPKSNFEMRGNLAIKEPNFIKRWEDNNLYEACLLNRKEAKSYTGSLWCDKYKLF